MKLRSILLAIALALNSSVFALGTGTNRVGNPGHESATLSATRTLAVQNSNFQYLTASGANRDCVLTALSESYGRWFIIKNAGASYNIVVKTAAGGTVITLTPGSGCIVSCDGATWKVSELPGSSVIAAQDFGTLGIKTDKITESTNSAGVSFSARVITTDGVTGGTGRVVGGIAYVAISAGAAVSNTAVETLFTNHYEMPAGTVKVGTTIRIRYQVIATATNGADQLAVKLMLGPVGGSNITLISHASTDVADNNVVSGEMVVTCRTTGVSGTVVGMGTYKSIPAAEGTAAYKDEILPSTAFDTTIAQQIGVTATWSNASSSNSCRLDNLVIWIE